MDVVQYFILFSISFLISIILTSIILFIFSKFKVRQIEREEGLQSHKTKNGTPTMGGIGFILTIVILSFLFDNLIPIIFIFLGYALIGFADDFVKVFNKRNLGLTFWQKIILQILIAVLFSMYILFFTSFTHGSWLVEFLGIPFYILFSAFIIVGCGNATNITDGLDGLLAGISVLAFFSFFIIALFRNIFPVAILNMVFAGAILGFLIFNFPKAKIFMGDTGSLSIGATLAGVSIILHCELLLAIIGGLFLLEALSVIIQVTIFKLTKKRVFKMAPLHHHFELMGLSEIKVVLMFWVAQLILSIIGVFLA